MSRKSPITDSAFLAGQPILVLHAGPYRDRRPQGALDLFKRDGRCVEMLHHLPNGMLAAAPRIHSSGSPGVNRTRFEDSAIKAVRPASRIRRILFGSPIRAAEVAQGMRGADTSMSTSPARIRSPARTRSGTLETVRFSPNIPGGWARPSRIISPE